MRSACLAVKKGFNFKSCVGPPLTIEGRASDGKGFFTTTQPNEHAGWERTHLSALPGLLDLCTVLSSWGTWGRHFPL